MKIIGFAAAQMVNDIGVLEFEGNAVGKKTHRFSSKNTNCRRPADSMIEVIVFTNKFGRKCENDELSNFIGSFALEDQFDLSETIGLARIHNKEKGYTKAKFLRSHSTFRMPCPRSGELTSFYDAIEIVPIEDDFISKNDVGTLVTTDQNIPVGLIICGDENRAFLAPIESLISKICGRNMSNISFSFTMGNFENIPDKIRYKITEIDKKKFDKVIKNLSSSGVPLDETKQSAKELSTSIFGSKVD